MLCFMKESGSEKLSFLIYFLLNIYLCIFIPVQQILEVTFLAQKCSWV